MKGDDSAVAHVADGVVGGGKAVVSTLLEPRRHTFSRCSKSAMAAAGGGSETAPPHQATRHSVFIGDGAIGGGKAVGRTLLELHATPLHAQGAATAASRLHRGIRSGVKTARHLDLISGDGGAPDGSGKAARRAL